MSSLTTIALKIDKRDRELLNKICKARGESISSFVRRAVRREFARLGFLSEDELKALG